MVWLSLANLWIEESIGIVCTRRIPFCQPGADGDVTGLSRLFKVWSFRKRSFGTLEDLRWQKRRKPLHPENPKCPAWPALLASLPIPGPEVSPDLPAALCGKRKANELSR